MFQVLKPGLRQTLKEANSGMVSLAGIWLSTAEISHLHLLHALAFWYIFMKIMIFIPVF